MIFRNANFIHRTEATVNVVECDAPSLADAQRVNPGVHWIESTKSEPSEKLTKLWRVDNVHVYGYL